MVTIIWAIAGISNLLLFFMYEERVSPAFLFSSPQLFKRVFGIIVHRQNNRNALVPILLPFFLSTGGILPGVGHVRKHTFSK